MRPSVTWRYPAGSHLLRSRNCIPSAPGPERESCAGPSGEVSPDDNVQELILDSRYLLDQKYMDRRQSSEMPTLPFQEYLKAALYHQAEALKDIPDTPL